MTSTPGPAVDSRVGAVLFTDLVGFTEYTDTEGDVAALRVLEHQTGLMSGITDARPDARIVKELGDGLMVWFDAPLDAIEGAIAMLLAVEEARTTDTFPVAIRMGLHAGEVLPRGRDLIGATVNVAARIAALAGPGELLASEAAVDTLRRPAAGGPARPRGPGAGQGREHAGLAGARQPGPRGARSRPRPLTAAGDSSPHVQASSTPRQLPEGRTALLPPSGTVQAVLAYRLIDHERRNGPDAGGGGQREVPGAQPVLRAGAGPLRVRRLRLRQRRGRRHRSPDQEAAARLAVANCPEYAISIEEDPS